MYNSVKNLNCNIETFAILDVKYVVTDTKRILAFS